MSKILILTGVLFLRFSFVYAQTAEDYYNSGMAYEKINNLTQAVSEFSEAIEIRPDYATAYYGRAFVYFYEKEYDKAWADVHKTEKLGVTVDPDFISALKKASGKDH